MAELMERLKSEALLVADGAWGSELIELGLNVAREPADVWNLRHPDMIARLAEDYAPRSDVLCTNTFGANRVRLARFGLEHKLRKINTRGVKLANSAQCKVPEGRSPLLIAGSMGPASGPGDTAPDCGLLFDIFYEQASVLTEAGASFILLETMTDLPETRVALQAVRAACPLEIVCSFAFRETGPGRFETWSGDSVAVALATALEEGAEVVGANCIPANASLLPLIVSMRRFAGDLPLWLKPNAGQPTRNPGPARVPAKTLPERIFRVLNQFSEFIHEAQWGPDFHEPVMNYPCPLSDAPIDQIIDALGTGVLGGCCGTSSIDIAMIRRELNRRAGLW